MMKNCYNEFIAHTDKRGVVICAEITHGDEYANDKKTYSLRLGHSPDEYEAFLKSLDFGYDAGYGGQELFGTIWYEDGTWSSRGEYDGSEWWEYNKCPEIPQDLKEASSRA